ncbi:MAG: PAS domain-containing protein [Campylobacterota bacterium]|nr:PAS domain-containing protein [Campylobacterota bacterium]
MLKLQSTFQIKLFFIVIFLVSYLLVFYVAILYKENLIDKQLNYKVKELEINFNITSSKNKIDARAINFVLTKNEKLLNILKKAKDADEHQRNILRDKLYKLFDIQYQAMRKKGVLQFQFVLPDNTSFLRMHKPSRYGDNLADVRYSFKYTNETEKLSFGFEQGRTAHAFRNVFPVHKNGEYLGSFEVSYTSESMQKNLLDINKIYSHFLVNKKIFDTNAWERKDLVLKYTQSIENKNYMFTLGDDSNRGETSNFKTILIDPNRKYIEQRMSNSDKFAFYKKIDNYVKVVAFLPIKNIKDKKTIAYLVSYSKDDYLYEILTNFRYINIIFFFSIGIILSLIYKQFMYKRYLQDEISIKTQSLVDLNNTLDEKVKKRTKEQNQLLSLFDKGNITLFKWKNDEEWSVEYVSDNVEDLTGYTKREFLDKKISYSSIINSDDLETVFNEVHNAISTKTDLFIHKPYKILTKNNEVKWLYDTTSVLRDSDGEITYFLGYIIDITQMKTMEIKLNELNEHLQDEVDKQTKNNLKKDKILQEQSKLAAMGEMVGAIAHQWRQPLNSLNINIQNLDDDYADKLIDEEFIDDFIVKQTKTIQFMSSTIDDFRNFFRVDKIKKIFSVKEAIEATTSIQSAQLKNSNISLEILGDDFQLETLESEFHQVILNLITNAKDELIKNNIEHGKITITIEKNKIVIGDNAGGVPKDIINRVFEPYFTTKEQGKGTGMGLYMSKMIIEQNIGGTLSVKNSKDGAEFTISFLHKLGSDKTLNLHILS